MSTLRSPRPEPCSRRQRNSPLCLDKRTRASVPAGGSSGAQDNPPLAVLIIVEPVPISSGSYGDAIFCIRARDPGEFDGVGGWSLQRPRRSVIRSADDEWCRAEVRSHGDAGCLIRTFDRVQLRSGWNRARSDPGSLGPPCSGTLLRRPAQSDCYAGREVEHETGCQLMTRKAHPGGPISSI